ncbi:MAG: hypothetical protein ABI835_10915 [Chloroflexota bacterium]
MKWVDKLLSAKLIAFTQFGFNPILQWIIPVDLMPFIAEATRKSVYPGSHLMGMKVWQAPAVGIPDAYTVVASIESPGSFVAVQVLLDGTIIVREFEPEKPG